MNKFFFLFLVVSPTHLLYLFLVQCRWAAVPVHDVRAEPVTGGTHSPALGQGPRLVAGSASPQGRETGDFFTKVCVIWIFYPKLWFWTYRSQCQWSPCIQTPVVRKNKKARSKALSPMPNQMAPVIEEEQAGGKGSAPATIPSIVLKLTGKEYPTVSEMLKGSVLPQLEEVKPTIADFFSVLCFVYFPACPPQNVSYYV